MLRIAVCDDDREQLEQISRMLRAYLLARPGLDGTVTVFSDGETLLAGSGQNFDLCLLDVLMPGCNGIQTGLALRALGKDCQIIYLSASDEYAVESYEVGAFFYLLKPVEPEKLFQVLDRAVDKLDRRRNQAVMVQTADGVRRVLLANIRYVERTGRSIRYHCTDGTVDSRTIRTAFREAVAPLLTDPRFALCGASFVLNFQHVTAVQGQAAQLDDGSSVTLPRTSAADFKRAWGQYWLEESPSC